MTVNSISQIDSGAGAVQAAKLNGGRARFSELLERLQSERQSTLASEQIAAEGRLNGDYAGGFSGAFCSEADRSARPQGAAANQANGHVRQKDVDRTSRLYEKALELESYFVKQMLSSMRKTVSKSALGGGDFAGQMYEDMLFDEYAARMTKNAGFGLADQIYLQLS